MCQSEYRVRMVTSSLQVDNGIFADERHCRELRSYDDASALSTAWILTRKDLRDEDHCVLPYGQA